MRRATMVDGAIFLDLSLSVPMMMKPEVRFAMPNIRTSRPDDRAAGQV